jgi:UDP-glucuronate decarboxylase
MDAPDDVTFPVNIGNPNEFTVLQLAETVLEMTGSPSRLVFKPRPEDDPKQRCPDITLAGRHLGWAPQTELIQGLQKTIEYFKAFGIRS